MKLFAFLRILFLFLCIIGAIGLTVLFAFDEITHLLPLCITCGAILIGLIGNAVCALIALQRKDGEHKSDRSQRK